MSSPRVRARAPRRRSFSRTLRYYAHRLLPRHGHSGRVAWSVALGIWIAVLPTLGIALALTALAAHIARVPKGPALVSSFVATPPTLFLFFYPLAYFGVGLPLLRPAAVQVDLLAEVQKLTLTNAGEISTRLWHDARGHVIAFLFGVLVVATATAAMGFGASYLLMEQRRRVRLAARAERLKQREILASS
ncbi:MAG: DUF2062 domain-containing protein [Myxococcales bacterium]